MDEIITNERGARQSRIGVKFTDFSPEALLRVGRTSAEGFAKYGAGNWQKIDQADHIDHAINHLLEYQAGNTSEDHLAHAACRVLFAIGTEEKPAIKTCETCARDVEGDGWMCGSVKPCNPTTHSEWIPKEGAQ